MGVINMVIKATKQTFWKKITCTTGGFSPFMFGMLASVAVFSSMMEKWHMEELKREEIRQTESKKSAANQVVLAIENSILTENVKGNNNYNKTISVASTQRFMSGVTGFNGSGSTIQLKTGQLDTQLGRKNERIIVNINDDAHLANRIDRLQGDDAMTDFDEVAGTRLIDTNGLRQRQIKASRTYLESESSHVYRSYVSFGYKFPTSTEYEETIQAATGLKDAWGQDFEYERLGDKKATLSFTTPWGYTVTKQLNME